MLFRGFTKRLAVKAVRRGLLGGSPAWITVFVLLFLRWVSNMVNTSKSNSVIYRKNLLKGESIRITNRVSLDQGDQDPTSNES